MLAKCLRNVFEMSFMLQHSSSTAGEVPSNTCYRNSYHLHGFGRMWLAVAVCVVCFANLWSRFFWHLPCLCTPIEKICCVLHVGPARQQKQTQGLGVELNLLAESDETSSRRHTRCPEFDQTPVQFPRCWFCGGFRCGALAGHLKAVWPNFWGCVFEVWPAPGARERPRKGGV